jgi:hypothetical protein
MGHHICGYNLMAAAPCAQIYIALELTCSGEIAGRLVHTGCETEDVAHRYCCHLVPNSNGDPLDCLMCLSHHLARGMVAAMACAWAIAATSRPTPCSHVAESPAQAAAQAT